MKTLLISTLEALGYPVYLQGSIDPNEAYPADFITFFTLDTPNGTSYDNAPGSWRWQFQVAFYSVSPERVASVPASIRATLAAAGFLPDGKGRDLPSDEPTHTGWTQDYIYIEQNKED